MNLNKYRVSYIDFSGESPKNRRKVVEAENALEAMDKVEAMNGAYSPISATFIKAR